MKRLAVFFLGFALIVGFSTPCLAGSLRADWQNAKKAADKDLKEAKLKKLSAYVKFNKDLGPNLEKLEKITDKSPSNIKFKMVEKDSKLSKAFLGFCKSQYSEENFFYYYKGYKGKPEKVYEEYIKDGAKQQLNINSNLKAQWDACAKSKSWKPCKALDKPTRGEIGHLMESDTWMKFISHLNKNPKENPYYQDPEPLKEKVLAATGDYQKQVEKMDAKAKDAKKTLLKALDKIEKAVKKI